jgi:hypothetical protein
MSESYLGVDAHKKWYMFTEIDVSMYITNKLENPLTIVNDSPDSTLRM